MTKEQQQVAEWMRLAGQEVKTKPAMPDVKVQALRLELIREELDEMCEATGAEDLVEIADAIGDLLYVVLGAACAYGIDLEPVFQEIHRSNASKFAEGHYRREDGKLIKSPLYSPANLAPILAAQSQN